ncbi:kinase-like protein [Backusella circina FSU 941]|nr:kinase-like protein [Backusella circina FSU 941]
MRRRHSTQVNIGVIETTMLYQFANKSREQLISVFTLFVEEGTRYLVLTRYYQDFEEFDKRIKHYSRHSKVPLPKLKDDASVYHIQHNDEQRRGIRKILYSFSKMSPSSRFSRLTNSDKLEVYLERCLHDVHIRNSTLFREFLQPQREEDNVIPKQVIQSYVQQQQQQNAPVIDDVQLPDTHLSSILSSTKSSTQEKEEEADIVHSTLSDRPTTIQEFQLIKVIGRGCMGKVLLVRHRTTQRLLALKAISKKLVIETSQVGHIKAEQQILSEIAAIQHPFLIKLHYSFQDMNQLFLVLDYHVGGDLATQLQMNHRLPPERCRFYTAEILLGIQELHRLDILYRDLKPENILLTADGHLVLTDFGLSKQFYEGLTPEEQRADTFCGTAEYLAPEIIESKPYSYEVDYWSMGTILYEMLTGVTPFWSEDRSDMYRRIVNDPLEFPSYIDIETAAFIAHLLKRDPTRRLGHGPDGKSLVLSDPYFDSIIWDHVLHKRIRPPYIPKLNSDTDFSHFDDEFLRMTPRLSPVASDNVLNLDGIFEGYSYTNREEVLLDSPASEPYSLPNPNPPIPLDATYKRHGGGDRPRHYIFHDSDMDEYDETDDDDIQSSDLVRSPKSFHHHPEEIPPRTSNRRFSMEDAQSSSSILSTI